jgi:putative transposase
MNPQRLHTSKESVRERGRVASSSVQKYKRRKNFNDPGHAHELTWSCYRRMKLLHSDFACEMVACAINKARITHNFAVWAYVFMPEHIHLLIHPRELEYDIALIRKAIKQAASQRAISHLKKSNPEALDRLKAVNSQGIVSHRFWQEGGGYDRNLFSPKAIRAAINYIHANPLRRGLVESIFDWKWSSARAFHAEGDSPILIDVCEAIV